MDMSDSDPGFVIRLDDSDDFSDFPVSKPKPKPSHTHSQVHAPITVQSKPSAPPSHPQQPPPPSATKPKSKPATKPKPSAPSELAATQAEPKKPSASTTSQRWMSGSKEVLGTLAKRASNTASVTAHAIAQSSAAKATQAASLEAARYALDRTSQAMQKVIDPTYGAFWEPRCDRFSTITWYERQLVHETCELPIDEAPPILHTLQDFVPPPTSPKSKGERGFWNKLTSFAENVGHYTPAHMQESSGWLMLSGDSKKAEEGASENTTAKPARWKPVGSLDETGYEDADDDYAMAQQCIRTPPPWREDSMCAVCDKPFGVTRYRHHCRNCGRSVCHEHSSQKKRLPRYGYCKPVRVCDDCFTGVSGMERQQRVAWRLERLNAFLSGHYIPYFDVAMDTRMSKARRLLEGTLYIAKRAPLTGTATVAVEVMDIIWKYGPPGLASVILRREFIEAAELLKKVSSVDKAWPISVHELTAAIYYLLALKRGERGADPDIEEREVHRFGLPGGGHLPDEAIHEQLHIAPFALHFIYETTPTQMQLLAAQKGFWLLFANMSALAEKPSFAVFTQDATHTGGKKRAVLAIRGTSSVHDVVTDIRTLPIPFPPKRRKAAPDYTKPNADGIYEQQPLAHSTSESTDWEEVDEEPTTVAVTGMARAALWVLSEVEPVLDTLISEGYELVITGHSLGGAVASLIGILLHDRKIQGLKLKVYTFGCPSCMDETLCERCTPFTTSVVLHDDVVPRVTPMAVRHLVTELVRQKECCMDYWYTDLESVWGRVQDFWAPRWRDSFLRAGALPPSVAHMKVKQPHPPSNKASKPLPSLEEEDHQPLKAEKTRSRQPTTPQEMFPAGSTVLAWGIKEMPEPAEDKEGAEEKDEVKRDVREEKGEDEQEEKDEAKEDKGGDMKEAEGTSALSASQTSIQSGGSATDDKPTEPLSAQDVPRSGETNSASFGGSLSSIRFPLPPTDQPYESDPEPLSDDEEGKEGVGSRVMKEVLEEQGDEGWGEDFDLFHFLPTASNSPAPDDGDVVKPESPNLLDRSQSRGVLIVDEEFGARQSGWYPALVKEWRDDTCEVQFLDHDVRTAFMDGSGATNTLPSHMIRPAAAPMEEVDEESRPEPPPAAEAKDSLVDIGDSPMAKVDHKHPDPTEVKELPQATEVDVGEPVLHLRSINRVESADGLGSQEDLQSSAIIVDELELPDLYIPGKVIHIYSTRGVYRAVEISRKSELLTRIRMYGNMLADHTSQSYYDGLAEVLDVRHARKPPPRWVAYNESEVCSCCHAEFSWHATTSSTASRIKDKHNCRCCGKLVCDPCSRRRRTLPRLGLNIPVRVCDRCYYDSVMLNEGPLPS